jgi:hypothetical protein
MILRRGFGLVIAAALLLAALGLAAVVDHSPAAGRAVPGFGVGPVQSGTARSATWDAVRQMAPRLDAGSGNACERGDTSCLDAVLAEMGARLDLTGCNHEAVFAFTYIQMTQAVQRAVATPGFFHRPDGTVHLDALFARLYFDAADNWRAGRLDDVPGAWRIAFGAAESGHTSAAADMLLGMNAHIARDLPYAVALAIEANPALADDPTDFTRVNDVIAGVKDPMLHGAGDRYDPALASLDQPLPALAGSGSVDIIGRWRNRSFEQGKRLATAPESEKAAIAAEIERDAVTSAILILDADSSGQLPTSVDRDTYCETKIAG